MPVRACDSMISSDTLSVRVLLDVNPQCAGVPDDIVEPTTRTLSQTDRWRGKVAFPKNGGTVKEGIGNWDEQNYQIARRSLEKRNLRGFTEDEAILRQGDIRSSSKTRTVRGSITAAYSPGGMLGKTRSGADLVLLRENLKQRCSATARDKTDHHIQTT